MQMTDFVHTLQLRLRDENINFGNDTDSILSFLCDAYYDHNCSHESDEIKQAFEDLYEAMNGKTIREMDEIIYPVCSLCRAHQELGFSDGVRLGLILAQEMNK